MTGDEAIGRDFDGDNKTDCEVIRRSNGQMNWYILRSSDGGFTGNTFGLTTDFSAPGDYDGDGKWDVAVQRPGANANAQGTFYILQSSNGGLLSYGWGLSNNLVVPGDMTAMEKLT